MMIGLIGSILYQIREHERAELMALGEFVRGELRDIKQGAHEVELGEVVSVINEKLSFLFDEEDRNLGYGIYFRDEGTTYKYFLSEDNPFEGIEYYEQHAPASFERWTSYKACAYYRWLPANDFAILVVSKHVHDQIDAVLAAFAFLLPLGTLGSVLLGMFLGRKVTGPMSAISRAARKMEAGERGVQVEDIVAGPDITATIDTLNVGLATVDEALIKIQQFSGDVAHELKTPLTIMRGNLEVSLRHARTPEEYQEVHASCIEELVVLGRLVDTLLMLTALDDPAPRVVTQECELKVIASEVIDHLSVTATEKNVRCEVIPSDDLCHVAGDAALLYQLIYNLVHNAIKFSQTGGLVTLELVESGGMTRLTITDQGIGVAPDDHDRVFDRLYQTDPSRHVGHGLGLSLVKWIVDHHGGTIELRSQLGEGATFTVNLPTDR